MLYWPYLYSPSITIFLIYVILALDRDKITFSLISTRLVKFNDFAEIIR